MGDRRGLPDRLVIALAAALFAGVSALRLLLESPAEPVTSLYVLPVALLAVRFGARAGVLAAALALGLSLVVLPVAGLPVTASGTLERLAIFGLLGLLLGRSSDRARVAIARAGELAEVAESSHDAVYSVFADGSVASWNAAAERLFGWSRHEILGSHISRIAVHGEERRQERDVATGGEPGTVEVRRRARDGSELDLELTLSPLRGVDGSVRGTSVIAREIGERKRMQAALADSNQRLDAAQAVAHLGSWEWDIAAGRVMWSRELLRIYGLPAESADLSFEDFVGLLHPGDRDRVLQVLEGAVAEAGDFVETFRIIRADGAIRWIESRGEIVTGPDGEASGLVGTALDVTDRTLAERQLREAEEQLRSLVRRLPAVIYTADMADGECLFISPQIETLLGYTPEEWLEDPTLWRSCIHPGDLEMLVAAAETAAAEGRPVSAEYRMQARDGAIVWVRDHGGVTETDDGRLVLEGVLTDITAQKAAEEALRASERSYRTIVETTREGVWTVDPDGRTTFVNARMADMLGETVETMGNRPIMDFLSPKALAFVRQHTDEAREAPGMHTELELRRSDGAPLWAQVSTSPLVEEGVYKGQLAVVTDITDRRAAEEERARLQSRLHQHERMESVGQLAGGIAHDFNNLLAVILTYANFAAAELEDNPVRDDIEEILRAAERAAALTRQLLVFSRRELTRPELVDLNEVVNETDSMLRRTLGENLVLEVRCEPELWPLKADRAQIEQVLLNLAINARDAMQRGGKLSIETSNVHLDQTFAQGKGDVTPGPYVRLAVTDTGHGMSAEVMERVYEPFFTTKPQGQGTGLGLATVYGIVQQSGGRIDIYSEESIGTVFKVYFPAALEESAVVREPAPPVESIAGRGEKVLLVEDEPAVRRVVKRALDQAGYVVLDTADPLDGLAMFQELGGQLDLLFTDVVMPGMPGSELAERLRATRPDLKVLYSSGYTDDVMMRHGIAEERMAFIEKPFSPERLLRKVREVLDADRPVAVRD